MTYTPVTIWRRQKKQSTSIGQQGKIVQWTMIRVATNGFGKQVPYPVILVKLFDGKITVGQLVDWEKKDLKKGKHVISVLRRLGSEDITNVISYHIKFKPI